jgi:hypothetical protein
MHQSGQACACGGNRRDAGAKMTTSSPHTAIAPGATVTILLVLIVTVSVHFGIALLHPSSLSPEAQLFFDAAPFPGIAFILTTSLILLSFQPWRGLSRIWGIPIPARVKSSC